MNRSQRSTIGAIDYRTQRIAEAIRALARRAEADEPVALLEALQSWSDELQQRVLDPIEHEA